MEHCLLVFKSQANRGNYPAELLPTEPEFLGKQGFTFIIDALDNRN